MIYDALTDDEILIAKSAVTSSEEQSLAFNKNIPRGKDATLFHRLFHKFVPYYAMIEFGRKNIGHHSQIFSDRTTSLQRFDRFFHLFRILRKIKPQNVLEFGGGASTVFIAEVLRLNERDYNIKGKCISFEQSEKYYNLLMEKFPVEFNDFAEIKLCPVRLKWYNSFRGIYYDLDYQEIPKNIDFVYRRLNSDIVNLVKSGFDVAYAITDHRYANFPFYQYELGNYFDIKLLKYYRSIEMKKK